MSGGRFATDQERMRLRPLRERIIELEGARDDARRQVGWLVVERDQARCERDRNADTAAEIAAERDELRQELTEACDVIAELKDELAAARETIDQHKTGASDAD